MTVFPNNIVCFPVNLNVFPNDFVCVITAVFASVLFVIQIQMTERFITRGDFQSKVSENEKFELIFPGEERAPHLEAVQGADRQV